MSGPVVSLTPSTYWAGWKLWTLCVLAAELLLLSPIYVLLYLIWRKG